MIEQDETKQFTQVVTALIIIITSTAMAKDQQRALQLSSLLSKLLDSLCSEVCVNRRDDNSISLLEIIMWRRKGDIDEAEFIELYRSWLESKSVFDLFTCKQIETYPKSEFIFQEIVRQNFMSISQINKALEMLNMAYNKLYIERKPNNSSLLDQAERIFSYLDTPGYIHLRLSSIFFFTGASVILQRYTVPLNYEAFKIHMNDIRKQACELNGTVSLRCFKNYILNLNSVKRTNYLQNLLSVFAQIQSTVGGDRNCLPNLFDDAFYKWKSFPRFSSTENRKNLQNYKRVFEENETVFYDEGATLDYFLSKYGQQFTKCFQIDAGLLREFNVLLKQSLNRYIEIFMKVSHKLSHKNNEKNSSSFTTHRKKQPSELQQTKLSKMSSLRQKTPTKSQKNIDVRSVRTPTKVYNMETKVRKQFESAQKSKQKSYGGRALTPTKSFKQSGLHQSQAYTATQKSAVKLGIEKDSFYNKMLFFRNKRVESYEIVMKRLKGK